MIFTEIYLNKLTQFISTRNFSGLFMIRIETLSSIISIIFYINNSMFANTGLYPAFWP